MQVSYKLVGGGGGWTPLFSESAITDVGDSPRTPGANPSWEPEFNGLNQIDPTFSLPGGNAPRFKRQLGNVVGQVSFEVVVAYGSRADAAASIRIWGSLFQSAAVHFRLVQDAETQYYPNAVVEKYAGKLSNGVSVRHAVTFTSDLVTATEPN